MSMPAVNKMTKCQKKCPQSWQCQRRTVLFLLLKTRAIVLEPFERSRRYVGYSVTLWEPFTSGRCLLRGGNITQIKVTFSKRPVLKDHSFSARKKDTYVLGYYFVRTRTFFWSIFYLSPKKSNFQGLCEQSTPKSRLYKQKCALQNNHDICPHLYIPAYSKISIIRYRRVVVIGGFSGGCCRRFFVYPRFV